VSELFPPINEPVRVNLRVDPAVRVITETAERYRVFEGKQIIDTEVLTLYDGNGTIKSVRNTAQMIDLLI
jgi:hypothetical protein